MSEIGEGDTALTFLVEIKLDDCELSWLGGANINVSKIVVNSQLKDVNFIELTNKFAEFYPKTFLAVLAHFN